MAGGADPCRPVHAESDVALLADGRLAGVEAHAYAYLHTVRPLVLGECALRDDGGCESRLGAGKGEEERVSLVIDLASLAPLDGVSEDALVLLEHVAVALPELLEQPCGTLDVGE